MVLGRFIKQAGGFKAFIPADFPPAEVLEFSSEILVKAALAERLIGKLDGVSQTLPNVDFFLSMYVAKDATYSSQIEGTRATLLDALELDAGVQAKETDADDILFYIRALNYGLKRLKTFPFSLRFVRELHKELMTDARSSQFANAGEFRRSQNWVGGTKPGNAEFVPPPVESMNKALNDWEKFVHLQNLVPVIQAGLLHAQFETIHPFLDGNGRTGRLLITLFLYDREVLEKPVLFLSSYFKKHRQLYYKRLNDYHNSKVEPWLDFFLDGIIDTANESIDVSGKIHRLRETDMRKIQALGKREAASGMLLLQQLFKTPIVTTSSVAAHTGFSRMGAQKVIDRFIALDVLKLKDETVKYGKTYIYQKYVNLFG
ncbi:MAG: Fic family protein [Chitinophagales bacterium]